MVTMGVLCFVISGAFILTLMIKKLRKYVTHKGMLYAVSQRNNERLMEVIHF
jgi:cytochrome d ubiquinol oxidase subunit I